MGLNRDLRAGTSTTWEFQVLNAADSVPTGLFLDSDVLSCALWQGSSDAAILTKSSATSGDIAWISATDAQFSIAFNPPDTASLPRGTYYLEAQATRGSAVADLLPKGTTLTLVDTPGTAATRPTYVDATDLRRLAPWIDDAQAPGSEAGFLEQCADARDWLDENVLRNYGGGYVSLLGEHGVALASWAIGGSRRSSIRNPWILQLLQQGPAAANANGGLIVTRRTRDICAYYALYRICDGMLTRGSQYAALAARYRQQANQLLVSYVAELSVNGSTDQWGNILAQIPVNFGTARTLRV